MIMQTTCIHTIYSNNLNKAQPNFCPKNCKITSLGPRNKAAEKIRSLRTSFSESSLSDVKITLDRSYTRIVQMQLESEFFHQEPFFNFTFDENTFLFLWVIDRLRERIHGVSDKNVEKFDQVESWTSMLKYAENLYNQFLETSPHLNSEDYLSNIRMIAILISMKFYYDDDRVLDAHFIRAFYLSKTDEDEEDCDFYVRLHEVAGKNIAEIDVGITVYQIRKMEAIFLSSIFKHTKKEIADDTEQSGNLQTNSTRPFGSSSV